MRRRFVIDRRSSIWYHFFMSTPLSPFGLLAGAAAALAFFVALTWLCSKWWYGREIGSLIERARKHDQAQSASLAKQQNLVSQVNSLRTELRGQKALAISLGERANERGKTLEAANQVVAALNEPFITSRAPKRPPDFEDTQIL